jgi:hypothetical protein
MPPGHGTRIWYQIKSGPVKDYAVFMTAENSPDKVTPDKVLLTFGSDEDSLLRF